MTFISKGIDLNQLDLGVDSQQAKLNIKKDITTKDEASHPKRKLPRSNFHLQATRDIAHETILIINPSPPLQTAASAVGAGAG
jgi:hypothetical protein